MVIDTLLFNNEFDMLDIHLAITDHYVDRWVVLEASRTFSGIAKPYNLLDNLHRYQQQYGDRLRVVTLALEEHQTNLICETMMRQSIAPALADCAADDIVIHGDLDEIINPESWADIVTMMDQHNQPVSCGFEMYMYKFDQRAERGWKGSVVARRSMFDTPHELYKGASIKRKNRDHCVGFPTPVGWHWTWMGSDDLIRNKVVSCIESQHRDPEQILSAFKQRDTISAINHKATTHVIDIRYPEMVQSILKRYPTYWHNPPGD
jgi:beta-1,4-mannosyl-glycoprotein beta-1,4-N-acetylglucosaminyltransferase